MNNSTPKYNKTPLWGAIVAGGLASACCLGPLLFVLMGLGSASIFITLEPYRPLFGTMTLGFLGWAGWKYWRARKQCEAGGCVEKPPISLWILGCIAVILLISPSLLPYLLRYLGV